MIVSRSPLLYQITLASNIFLGTVSYADVTISTDSSTPLQTSTAGNIIVTSTGNLSTGNTVSIQIDSNNANITNEGKISTNHSSVITITGTNATINNKTGATLSAGSLGPFRGILVDQTATGFTLTNAGLISSAGPQSTIEINASGYTITNNGTIDLSLGNDSMALTLLASGKAYNNGTISSNGSNVY